MNPAKFWFNLRNPSQFLSQLDDDLTYAPLSSTLTEDENVSPWYIPQGGIGRIRHNINILNNRAINQGKDQAKIDIIRNLQSLGVPYYSAYIAADAAIQGNYSHYQKLLSKYSNSNTSNTNAINTSEGKLGLPISGMYDESAVNPETDEIPSGNIVVGNDPEEKVKTPPTVASAIRLRRSPKPSDNPPVDVSIKPKSTPTSTPASKVIPKSKPAPKPAPVQTTPSPTPVSTFTPPVAAPTLSSVVPQAIRHNGGFDNYRRESALAALRAAGGISPAEAVQRGIIPWEALNYV